MLGDRQGIVDGQAMLICDDPPFVFVSTPRSGTHAMYHFLAERYHVPLPEPGGPFHRRNVPGDKQGYFTFTSVRNPFRRAVSAWWMMTRRPEYWAVWKDRICGKSFETVLSFVAVCGPAFPGKGAYTLWTQTYWLKDVRLDDVLNLETIDQDFAMLPFVDGPIHVPRLGVDYKPTIGDYGDWRQWYTPRAIELVKQIYAADFERFGYSTDIEDAGE